MPIPFLFYIYGPRLRKLSKYAPDMDEMKRGKDEESSNGSNHERQKDQ